MEYIPRPQGWFLDLFPKESRRGQALLCFFVSDLHGRKHRYGQLWQRILADKPQAVFLGGDLLPHPLSSPNDQPGDHPDFTRGTLSSGFSRLRDEMGEQYPSIFLILGNDDPRRNEPDFLELQNDGLCLYAHSRGLNLGPHRVFGYSFVPPSPFLLKDWEKYDVSRFVDPGCVSPEEGYRTVPVPAHEIRYGTIAQDLVDLTEGRDLSRDIFLFHSPPYRTNLDRAGLDGKTVDHVPLDVHVGSIAIQRFIESHQPLITLHGHIHESARITGKWRDVIGRTQAFSAAHDGPELALVRFDSNHPAGATRELL